MSGRKDRWVGVDCDRRDLTRSAQFGGSTSIREDVDVRGTIEIVLLCPVPLTKKKCGPRRGRLRSRSPRYVVIVKELQFNFDIELGLEEGEKSDVVSQCLD